MNCLSDKKSLKVTNNDDSDKNDDKFQSTKSFSEIIVSQRSFEIKYSFLTNSITSYRHNVEMVILHTQLDFKICIQRIAFLKISSTIINIYFLPPAS